MTEPADVVEHGVTRVYTRQAVEDYLRAVGDKRIELEVGIVRARARFERATQLEQRIESLEQKVGEWVVLALALRRDPDASSGRLRLSPPPELAGPFSPVPEGNGVDNRDGGAVRSPAPIGSSSPGGELEVHAIDRLEQLQQHLKRLRATWPEGGSVVPAAGPDPGSGRD